ncbi:MAG: sigma 54-interacting transcriptional regulator, partial [Pseudomonadota bacterium]
FKIERLLLTINQTIESFKLKQENVQLRKRNALTLKMVGNSAAIGALKSNIEKLAVCNSRVLISGASGSGKELTARLLHKKSSKNLDPFVVYRAYRSAKYNVIEDFFGNSSKSGVFRRVNNGITYIDEISNLTEAAQQLLLRILQQQPIEGVNTEKIFAQDFRVISSTHYTYDQLMEQGFNNNLYQRLKVTTLRTPSLSEHKEDLKQLCEYFIDQIAHLTGIKPRPVAEEVIQMLQLYSWPGNIRELRLITELMSINADIAGLNEISCKCVSSILNNNNNLSSPSIDLNHELVNLSLRDAREQFEKKYLKMQIERCNGSISRTASIIGMERSALHRKLKTLGVAINRHQLVDEEISEMES